MVVCTGAATLVQRKTVRSMRNADATRVVGREQRSIYSLYGVSHGCLLRLSAHRSTNQGEVGTSDAASSKTATPQVRNTY